MLEAAQKVCEDLFEQWCEEDGFWEPTQAWADWMDVRARFVDKEEEDAERS